MLKTSMPERKIVVESPIAQKEWSSKSERLANALYEACLRRGLEPTAHQSRIGVQVTYHISVGTDARTFARCLTDAGRAYSELLTMELDRRNRWAAGTPTAAATTKGVASC